MKAKRDPSKQRYISETMVAFPEFMETIHSKADKNIKSPFPILVKKKMKIDGAKQWRRKKLRVIWRGKEEGEKIRGAKGFIMNWRNYETMSKELDWRLGWLMERRENGISGVMKE